VALLIVVVLVVTPPFIQGRREKFVFWDNALSEADLLIMPLEPLTMELSPSPQLS